MKSIRLNLSILLLIGLLTLQTMPVIADDPPPPPSNGGNGDTPPEGGGAPIGGGVIILSLLAAGYGLKKWHGQYRKKKE